MNSYKHNCPYCGTSLSVWQLDEEAVLTLCPHCQKKILLTEFGMNVQKPYSYRCPKCDNVQYYRNRIPGMICSSCQSIWKASEKGCCLISTDLYERGEKGEIPYTKKKDRLIAACNKWIGLPIKTKCSIVGSVATICILLFTVWFMLQPSAIDTTLAYADVDSLWTEFRAKNPINYQTVGIKTYEDGSYNILLSEPSPDITEHDLQNFIEKYHGIVITRRCPMGIDGWLQDAILCFNGMKEDHSEKFRSELFTMLYGTDYKAAYEDMNDIAGHTNYIKEPVNFQIFVDELQQWFITDEEPLISREYTDESNLPQLLNGHMTGVYYTKEPGFVIWIIDKQQNSTIPDFEISARIFALDADLILGAICKNSTIAIIGRERELSLHDLPPMRVETMRLLASTKDDELSQSYERNNLVAGKMPGGKDYAPILLSPELWHTEYGSMLNVTDQMLKSWSQNGEIEYESFVYPKPYDWAFVESASRDLNVSELTFNWNTSGTGCAIEPDDTNPYMIYAVNRTGSLPVSYIPGSTDNITEEDKVFLAEENAWDFFSNLASPELVKVVQYLSLYQIFVNCDFHLRYSFPDTYTINTENVDYAVAQILRTVTEFGETHKQTIREECNKQYHEVELMVDSLRSVSVREQSADHHDQLWNAWLYLKLVNPETSAQKRIANFDSLSAIVKDYAFIKDEQYLLKVSHYLVNPRDIKYERLSRLAAYWNDEDPSFDPTENDVAMYLAFSLMDEVTKIKEYNAWFNIIHTQELRDIYIRDNADSYSNWIKCPTVVQSWSMRDSTSSTGGHNLNSHITPIKVDKTLKKGQCVIDKLADGTKVIRVASEDMGRITPQFIRNVERTGKVGIQSFRGSAQVARARTIAVPIKPRAVRGFDPLTQVTKISRESDGFVVNGKKTLTVDEFWEEMANGIPEIEGKTAHTFEFRNISQDEVYMIMDGHPETILQKGDLCRTAMEDLDFKHMVVSSADQEGKVTVSIPMKSKTLIIGEGVDQKTIPLQTASMEIRIPSQNKAGWIKTLKELFSNPDKGTWSPFRLKRMGKQKGLNPDEIQELYQYKTAKNYYDHFSPDAIQSIQTQAA